MTKKYFIPRSHTNNTVSMAAIYIFVCLLIWIFFHKYIHPLIIMLFMLVILYFAIKLIIFFDKQGLYIENNNLYFKVAKKEKINFNDILGIKITKSLNGGGLGNPIHEMKDIDGNILYSVIFIKEVLEEMTEYTCGDILFKRKFFKQVMFEVIYDEEMVFYLKKLNPDLVIMSDME